MADAVPFLREKGQVEHREIVEEEQFIRHAADAIEYFQEPIYPFLAMLEVAPALVVPFFFSSLFLEPYLCTVDDEGRIPSAMRSFLIDSSWVSHISVSLSSCEGILGCHAH